VIVFRPASYSTPAPAQGEPQRADEVHLNGEGVEKGRSLEIVIDTRRTLKVSAGKSFEL
jgi:hypothetical protein